MPLVCKMIVWVLTCLKVLVVFLFGSWDFIIWHLLVVNVLVVQESYLQMVLVCKMKDESLGANALLESFVLYTWCFPLFGILLWMFTMYKEVILSFQLPLSICIFSLFLISVVGFLLWTILNQKVLHSQGVH